MYYHFYGDPDEEIVLLQAKNGVDLPKQIAIDSGLNPTSWINCSVFNGRDCLGRNQGNLYDGRPQPINEQYSIVIYKNGNYQCGNLNSWDCIQDGDINAGFTVQGVFYLRGERLNKTLTSTDICNASKFNAITDVMLIGKENGRWHVFYEPKTTCNRFVEELSTQYKFDILAMVDGGGSCDMNFNGTKICTTTRKIPNILAFVKKKDYNPVPPKTEPIPLVDYEAKYNELSGQVQKAIKILQDSLK